jgi:hypothetical protein
MKERAAMRHAYEVQARHRSLWRQLTCSTAAQGLVEAESQAIQDVFVRWLNSCGWPVPVSPAYRFRAMREE